MKFEFTSNSLDKISSDGVVVFAFEQEDEAVLTSSLSYIDKALEGVVVDDIKTENFKGKFDEILSISSHKKILSPKIFIVGLGKIKEFDSNKLREALATLAKKINKKVHSITLSFLTPKETDINVVVQSQVIAEGLLLGSYTFAKYKKKEKDEKEMEIVVISEINKNNIIKAKEGITKAQIYTEATKLARDLVNEPASVVTPTFLAKIAEDIAKENKEVKCLVYDREDARKMGMEAFLGIAQGSDTPPKFIVLEYNPKGYAKEDKLAIVGKGITFDTGGVSLKTEKSMTDMKCDMAGAAAVLGVFSVISEIKPKISVLGVIAATSNMVSGKSLVPGDVVRAMNGKTIEILNTDAEGRVTMADSLSYVIKKGATEIVDLATLTGACIVALGTDIAAIFGNNEALKNRVKKAALGAGEKVWELPLEKDYQEMNKSEVADISNIPSNRYAGAITAALFLEEFIDHKPWVHLDIAGPAFYDKAQKLGPKGGSGFGVRMLLNLLTF